jgi:hypothetical protein
VAIFPPQNHALSFLSTYIPQAPEIEVLQKMPPKKKGKGAQAPNKKTEEKKKEKIIEDKTFGLKNKKGAAQQKFIKGVKSQVHGAQKGGEQYQLNQEYKAREEKKKAKADNALLASLFKSVSTIKVDPNADPKTIPC